ncbi:hypothetical protein [Lysinibacillus sp. FSL K6-0102]|uniref:hypothetical protein n=1 Tax=Lysinibacillus sp. FSL K6-0102 TaxID=2975290 RepID=UPI0030FA76A1
MDFTKEVGIIDYSFAKEFQNRLISLYNPKHQITYWTFYAVIEESYGYNKLLKEMIDEFNLNTSFSFINELKWYEYDDFNRDFTRRVTALLGVPQGEIGDYGIKF